MLQHFSILNNPVTPIIINGKMFLDDAMLEKLISTLKHLAPDKNKVCFILIIDEVFPILKMLKTKIGEAFSSPAYFCL